MPIYEFRCSDCGKEFEVRQKFSDDPVTECIYCSGSVEKLISQSAFVLKGSGWYKTDYGPSSTSASAAPEKCSEAAESSAKGEKSSSCSDCPAAGTKND
jgi:putative FmdB family regulatory protein